MKNIFKIIKNWFSNKRTRMKKSKHEKRLKSTIIGDKEQKEYLNQQLKRSLSKMNQHSSLKQKYLIDKLRERVDLSNMQVLCIGCRSIDEIKYFKSVGAIDTIGIDLFSENKEILIMDMHNLTFEENSFNIIFSCHSLEHALDYQKAFLEFVRVAKNGAVVAIEVPVNYETRGADLWDFKSLQNFKRIFRPYIKEILFEEYSTKDTEYNFAGTDVIKIIFTIKKMKSEGE